MKTLLKTSIVLALIATYALVFPQYFPYEFLVKTYYFFM